MDNPRLEKKVLRVALISRVHRNPYVSLLRDGLTSAELGISPCIEERFSLRWLWERRRQVDVLHIHWLELFFLYPTWWRSLRRWLSVVLALLLARLLGICVVYTVHNIWQHEGRRAGLVWLGNAAIFALANAVHVHDARTAELLARRWRRRRGVYIVPHGSYIGAYPNECSREEARRVLGLPQEGFIYLFLGRLRPYKGVEELLYAFRRLEDEDALLLVAGQVHDPGYEGRIQALAEGDERIRLHLRFVRDEELQLFLNACDISVLPYRRVTTSGAALLSFSFGVPVIAPRRGCFVELVGEEERGLLYDPSDEEGLLRALQRARQRELAELRAASRRFAEELNWRDLARLHAQAYRQCVKV